MLAQIFICIFLQSNALYLFQYSPSSETGVRDGKAMYTSASGSIMKHNSIVAVYEN